MNRIPYGYADTISKALSCIPERIIDLVHVDFLCGNDPVFVGLHSFTDAGRYAGREWSFAECAHFHDPSLLGIRERPTIVLPRLQHWPAEVIHEVGHALHAVLGRRHEAIPCSTYAAENRWEAYAEAFTAWCGWQTEDGQWDRADADRATVAHFESLCA